MPMCRRVNVNVEGRFSRVTSDPWKSFMDATERLRRIVPRPAISGNGFFRP